MQYPLGIIRHKMPLFMLFWLMLFSITSCEKICLEEAKTILNQQNVNVESFSVLPVDLAEYNMLASTKSVDLEEEFIIDSLLKWEFEEQIYLEEKGVLLRQIPVKLSNGNIYCSITGGINSNCDTLWKYPTGYDGDKNPANYLNAIISTTTTDIVLLDCVTSNNSR